MEVCLIDTNLCPTHAAMASQSRGIVKRGYLFDKKGPLVSLHLYIRVIIVLIGIM